jgi:TorA maturation chaperone TorD
MTSDDDIYAARIELIDYLVECFYDAPDEGFVDRLLSGDLVTPGDSVNEAMDEGFAELRAFVEEEGGTDADSEAVAQRLRQAFTTLFVGPRPPVTAHETYYREGDFLGKGLAEVEATYSAAGWTPPEEYPEEDDYVAVELAFLRHLVTRQRRGAEEAFGYERVFLDEHLGQWADDLAADVLEHTDESFYRAAAQVLSGVVAFEDDLVASQMARS